MMQTDQTERGRRLLLFESDGLVAERVRQMASWEGISVCSVDTLELFHGLCDRMKFDLYVVGAAAPGTFETFAIPAACEPLVLLVPMAARGGAGHVRHAFPGATLVDRGLRDPDALRRAVDRESDAGPPPPDDAVQQAFGSSGLSNRQREVLERALLGESTNAIAEALFISAPTVRNHLHAIYEQVGVSGRRELLGRFVSGLIERGARS